MISPLDRVRERIATFRRAENELLSVRIEGGDETGVARVIERARRALGTGENRSDLDEARSLGLLDGTEPTERLLLEHLADVAGSEVMARLGTPLHVRGDAPVLFEGREHALLTLAREATSGPAPRTEPRLSAIAAVFDRDRRARLESLDAEAEAHARVLLRAPEAPDVQLDARAERFLAATNETLRELFARASHARGVRGEGRTALLQSLVSHGGAHARSRRITALLAPLGLDGALARGVRLAEHVLASTRPVLVVRDSGPATVAASTIDLGTATAVGLTAASVHALSLSLVPRATPFEVRHGSSHTTLPAALGTMLAVGLTAPRVVARSLGHDERAARAEALGGGLALLLDARVQATQVLSLRSRPNDEDARLLGAHAVGEEEPLPSPELGRSSSRPASLIVSSARATLVALAAAASLRDRFDVDWARNPRVEQVVRAAAHHGATLSAERWLSDFGGDLAHADTFGRDLAGG